jgi:hypothetical protein
LEESDEFEEKEIIDNKKFIDPYVYWLVQHEKKSNKIIKPRSTEKLDRTNKEICEDYLRSPQNFRIFHEDRLLFDSSLTDRANIVFYDDYFTLYGKSFRYNGMRITQKLS